MKNPLHYQISEYDCGPASMLNAVSFLFEREEIPPEIIRNIMLYSLDNYGKNGMLYAFDPYYRAEPFDFAPDIRLDDSHPTCFNRIIPSEYLNCEENRIYALGPKEEREVVLLYNERIKLTPERTIEYFI